MSCLKASSNWNIEKHRKRYFFIQGLLTGFDIFWRPQRPTKNKFLVKMIVSVNFWGIGIKVSSISFLKSSIGWPQQLLTEKVLKFNMSFQDSVKKFFFQNFKINGLNSFCRPISSKEILILLVWSSMGLKWPILVIFCGMDHQKSNFSLIYGSFSGCVRTKSLKSGLHTHCAKMEMNEEKPSKFKFHFPVLLVPYLMKKQLSEKTFVFGLPR